MNNFEDAEGTQLSDLTEDTKDPKTLAEQRALIDRFDASQYAFFGKDVTQEVELGGLEDEDDTGQLGTLDDDEYGLSSVCDRDEAELSEAVSEADNMSELSSSFMRMNKVSGETRLPASIGDLGFAARECLSFSLCEMPVPDSWKSKLFLSTRFCIPVSVTCGNPL